MEGNVYYKSGKFYNVSFDENELERIRIDAINNSSVIIHEDYEGPYNYSPFYRKKEVSSLEVRNFKKEYVGIKKDALGRNLKMYHYEYDRYLFPYIEKLIRELLNGNVSVLDEVYNPDYVKEFVPLFYKINELEKELVRTDDKDVDKKISIVSELKYYLFKARRKDYDVPVLKYYEDLQNAVKLERIEMLGLKK